MYLLNTLIFFFKIWCRTKRPKPADEFAICLSIIAFTLHITSDVLCYRENIISFLIFAFNTSDVFLFISINYTKKEWFLYFRFHLFCAFYPFDFMRRLSAPGFIWCFLYFFSISRGCWPCRYTVRFRTFIYDISVFWGCRKITGTAGIIFAQFLIPGHALPWSAESSDDYRSGASS